jgi:transcription factor CON7
VSLCHVKISPILHGLMERSAPEYSQTGLPSPYPSSFGDAQSEASSVDHASAAQYASQQQEVRPSNYSTTTATPTSDYVYPHSARSTSSFSEHIQRSYHPPGTQSGSSGGMAQTTPSPSSMPSHDGRNHQSQSQVKSDSDVPIDPSIAAPSPTYTHGPYSPYAPPQTQEMSHGYAHSGAMYPQTRPDWANYGGQATPLTPGHHVFPQTPTSAAPPRPSQVSFATTLSRLPRPPVGGGCGELKCEGRDLVGLQPTQHDSPCYCRRGETA